MLIKYAGALNSNMIDVQSNKINKSAIANNLTTSDSGYVLDARQGKVLNDNMIELYDNIFYQKQITLYVPANSSYYGSYSVNCAVTGYTPLTLSGAALYQARLVFSQLVLYTGEKKIGMTIINVEKTAISAGTATFIVIYKKDI